MSRNMINYSKFFFEKIVGSNNVASMRNMRVAPEGSDEELSSAEDDFKKLKIASSIDYVFLNFKVFRFDIESQKYLTVTNFNDSLSDDIIEVLDEYSISPKEINTGIFLALVKDADLQVSSLIDNQTLEQEYLFQQEDPKYKGHILEDMKNCIEPISIFHISNESVFYEKSPLEIMYLIVSYTNQYIHLPIQGLLDDYRKIFITSIQRLPYENIFLSMTATHWKHSFLEVYRCVERLFVLPRTLELKEELGLEIPAIDIARQCFLKLGWKSKEEDALKKLLLDNCNSSLVSSSKIETISLFSKISIKYKGNKLTSESAQKIAARIYSVRNNFVHQFHDDDEINLDDNDLYILVKFLLQFISIIYSKYEQELSN